MTMVLAPEAKAAATALSGASWTSGLPAAGAGGQGCGQGLSGIAGVLMQFVQPLEHLMEQVQGDPAGLYHASIAWETVAGDAENAYLVLDAAHRAMGEVMKGQFAQTTEQVLGLLALGARELSDWSKVTSQMLQLGVRVVEIMRSIVCEAFELVSSLTGVVGDVAFGSWPWEVDKKVAAINRFADNCNRIVQDVVKNLDRVLQALRELVRLLTDLYRAIIPFHQQLDALLGKLLETMPPGKLLGPFAALPGLPSSSTGEVTDPGPTPFPGSDQTFLNPHPLGYQHEYDLGPSNLTTEQLNEMLRTRFGHLFLPSRTGDNSQINMQLSPDGRNPVTGKPQGIETSLFGMAVPGVTSGGIHVQQVTNDGFVIAADEGHPEYPGEVAFRIRNVDGHATFEVSGAYDSTILDKLGFSGATNSAYSGISDVSIWADMQYRLKDAINYGI